VDFTLVAQGDTTQVTQAMYGPGPFISKLMGLFFSMDAMVGEKYEEGLASLALGVVDPAANLSPGSVESRGDNNSKPLRGKHYATQ
jgi:hypothetical protein